MTRWIKSHGILLQSVIAVVGTLLAAGCGGGGETPPAAATTPAAAAAPAPAAGQPVAIAAAPAAPRSSATKWIGGIPYDVFYDRPLEVAADQTLLATSGAAPAAPVVPAATPAAAPATPMPQPAAPAAGGGGGDIDWAALAPMEVIVEEITNVRNELQAKLNTLADYGKNWETIGIDATELAALAGVVELHPADVSWKPNAKFVRHLASEVNANATKSGRTAFDATKQPYESLVDVLNGNAPDGVEAQERLPFGDYASRETLMYKMDATLNYAKSNITTQQRLEENPEEIKRRMTILATLMTIVATPAYGSAEEADYQGFIKTFVAAALSGREAVDAKDLAAFTKAIGDMQSTCTECHAKYKFE